MDEMDGNLTLGGGKNEEGMGGCFFFVFCFL